MYFMQLTEPQTNKKIYINFDYVTSFETDCENEKLTTIYMKNEGPEIVTEKPNAIFKMLQYGFHSMDDARKADGCFISDDERRNILNEI